MTARCPSCNAYLRPDAAWCSLCHHDLRPAPEPVSIPAPTQPVYAESDPLTGPLLDLVLPPVPQAELPAVPAREVGVADENAFAVVTWPCGSCGAKNALNAEICGTCGSKFLAAASELPSLVVPGIGDLQQLSRGHRAAVAAGFVAALLLPLALITLLLTKAPPATGGGGTETTVTNVSP